MHSPRGRVKVNLFYKKEKNIGNGILFFFSDNIYSIFLYLCNEF